MFHIVKENGVLIEEIRKKLFELQDIKYRDFQKNLIPTVDPESIIGVRTPELRKYAKQLVKENKTEEFLYDLPHKYFDENQLHAFILSELKDYEKCIDEVCRFLPLVDNWATCDQMSPNVFKKHRTELLEYIKEWLASEKTYTVRFGIGMLMQYYLDDWFDISYAEMVQEVKSEEYYINMMIAWYFATALAKQYDNILPILEQHRLNTWTHNKVIQKATESYRIMDEQKKYLKSLKIK